LRLFFIALSIAVIVLPNGRNTIAERMPPLRRRHVLPALQFFGAVNDSAVAISML
jgi:ketopantoate reductase